MTKAKYPGWRTMTAAQRYNARADRLFEDAKAAGHTTLYHATPATVTRYAATYINARGERTLMTSAQGRFMFETPQEAQAWIDAVTANNSANTVASVWGDNPRFEVRPCPCYPGHFDPQCVWFD